MNVINMSPNENGFLIFVLGLVFILSVYHFLLFFQHKDQAYIYYATYTSLIFIAYFIYPNNSFFDIIPESIVILFEKTHQFWVWIYNIFYFIFILKFLNFKKHSYLQWKILMGCLGVLFLLGFSLFVKTIITYDQTSLDHYYKTIFTPFIIVLTFWGFYIAIKTPEKTKNYILFGCLFLFLGSLLAILIIDYHIISSNHQLGFLAFYISIILENLCFSLGLGLKQKLIADERNTTQQKLIVNLKENQKLKETAATQLREKLTVLNEQFKLEQKVSDLKFKVLKNKVNPHFLFNALNSIRLYINKNDIEKANHYLQQFSKLIRKILEVSDDDFISLEEELEITNLYTSIENTRFKHPISYTVKIDNNISAPSIQIPSITLQTFIENAIWHGLSTKEKDKSILVQISQSKNVTQISITDNGIGRKAAEKINQNKTLDKKSLGIDLVQKRLSMLSNQNAKKYYFEIEDLHSDLQESKGTSVHIFLEN